MDVELAKADGRTSRRKSPELYEREVQARVGDEYTLLTKYEKSSRRIKVRHNSCGHEFDVLPSAFLYRPSCRRCAAEKIKISPEVYEKRFNEANQGKYELLTPYSISGQKVKIKHIPCGNVLEVFPRIGLVRPYCHYCTQLTRHGGDQLANMIYLRLGLDFKVIQTTSETNPIAKLQHVICGHEFMTDPEEFIENPNCPNCGHIVQAKTFTNEQFQQRLNQQYRGAFELVGDYRGSRNRVTVRHVGCGSISYPWASNLSRGAFRCPHCKPDRVIRH